MRIIDEAKKAEKIDNISKENIEKIVSDMIETMVDASGIGLAAPQVHISKRIIIFHMLEDNQDQIDQ